MSISTPNTTAPALPTELETLMRHLKMPHARGIAAEVLAPARAQRWEPTEIIKALPVAETDGRARSMLAARRKAARFPTGKSFATWDEAASSIPAPTQQSLRSLDRVHRQENLVLCGPSGTGKTFFLEAPGQQAVEEGLRVAWFTLEDLGATIRTHRADDTITKAVTRILRADLVVVDDFGLLPAAMEAGEGLYRVVDTADEKRSIAVSSNLHPAGFDELMPETLATATVDRLLHHAHVCQTAGDSIRLTQALDGKGVMPLGSSRGHQRARTLATYGQKLMAIDSPSRGNPRAAQTPRRGEEARAGLSPRRCTRSAYAPVAQRRRAPVGCVQVELAGPTGVRGRHAP